MNTQSNTDSLEVMGQKAFIQSTQPFDILNDAELQRITDKLDILYFQKGDIILRKDDRPESFYIVVKGVVEEIEEDGKSFLYASRDSFDAPAIINQKSQGQFRVLEESILFAFPEQLFRDLIKNNLSFGHHYLESVSQRIDIMVRKSSNEEFASCMVKRVDESLIHPAVVVSDRTPISEAVRLMSENHSSSVIVTCKTCDKPIGIVTDTDLREKVILKNLAYSEPIRKIATMDIISVNRDDFMFDALLKMTEHNIKRLIVKDETNRIIGTLEQIDLLSALSNRSHLIQVRVSTAKSMKELKAASEDLIHLIRTMHSNGVKVKHILKLLSELDTKIYKKLFEMLAPQDLINNCCLIVLGSEGRREQILKTDQDNALVLRDSYLTPQTEPMIRDVANKFTQALLDFGYPECPGGIMVNNPKWCKPFSDFAADLEAWLKSGKSINLMDLSIFFDARHIVGDKSLIDGLKQKLFQIVEPDKVTLSYFAKPTIMFETPLSLFSSFKLGKDDHKDELDLKKGGIFPMVHGIRSLALENRLMETNTIDRIKALRAKLVFDQEFADELKEAFNYLLTIRLTNRLKKMDEGGSMDNYINPENLAKLERDLLRDVFRIVDKLKKFINYHFHLDRLL